MSASTSPPPPLAATHTHTSPLAASVYIPSSSHTRFIADFADMHARCITESHTMATFLPPLKHEELEAYWEKICADTREVRGEVGRVVVFVTGNQMAVSAAVADENDGRGAKDGEGAVEADHAAGTGPEPEPEPEPESETGLGREGVAGVVTLVLPKSETGPFRGIVEKLLVHPGWRRRGVAKALMGKVDEVARGRGRTLLMLDTEEGSEAEFVYPKLGYIEVGRIPEYGISPKDGSLKTEVFFYKNLLKSE